MNGLYIIGDSVAKGVYFENGRYGIVKEKLYAPLEQKGIAVNNLSKMGATADKIKKIEDRITDFGNSDVVFSFGGNDCDYDWKAVSENPDGSFKSRTEPGDFCDEYSECIESARKKGAGRIVITNLIPIDCEKYFSYIARLGDAANIKKWLVSIQSLYRRQELYSDLCEKIALKNGCLLADIRTPVLANHAYGDLLCADGIHPTRELHGIIAENIMKCLESR